MRFSYVLKEDPRLMIWISQPSKLNLCTSHLLYIWEGEKCSLFSAAICSILRVPTFLRLLFKLTNSFSPVFSEFRLSRFVIDFIALIQTLVSVHPSWSAVLNWTQIPSWGFSGSVQSRITSHVLHYLTCVWTSQHDCSLSKSMALLANA